jgi:uncharacterized protein
VTTGGSRGSQRGAARAAARGGAPSTSDGPQKRILPRKLRTGSAATPTVTEWTFGDVAALLAVAVGAFVLKQALLGSLALELMPPEGRITAHAVILSFYQGIHIIAIALLVHRKGLSIESAFGLWGIRRQPRQLLANAALVGLLLLFTRAVSMAWAAALRSVGWMPTVPEGEQLSALFGTGLPGIVLTVAAVVVLAPIAEELIFRGVVLGYLAEKTGRWPGILVTAGLFSVTHMEAWVFIPTFVLSCALGWLALSRRSLVGAIVLHGLYNATALLAAYYVAG